MDVLRIFLSVFLALVAYADDATLLEPGTEEFLDSGAPPKYLRVNLDNYNIRNSYEFHKKDMNNVVRQTKKGEIFAITRSLRIKNGLVTGIMVDGEERWIYTPYFRGTDFTYCYNSECHPDLKFNLKQVQPSLDALTVTPAPCQALEWQTEAVAEKAAEFPAKPAAAELPPPRSESEVAALASHIKTSVSSAYDKWVAMGKPDCVTDTRGEPTPNFHTIKNIKARKKAFIRYVTPFALELQAATGIPAGLAVAQAALETGWGTSRVFRKTGNVFGLSCFKKNKVYTSRIEVHGEIKEVRGKCTYARPSNEGYWYQSFESQQDSVYAYAATLMNPKTRNYKKVQNIIKAARPGVANLEQVVSAVGASGYAVTSKYGSLLRYITNNHDLAALSERQLCPKPNP